MRLQNVLGIATNRSFTGAGRENSQVIHLYLGVDRWAGQDILSLVKTQGQMPVLLSLREKA